MLFFLCFIVWCHGVIAVTCDPSVMYQGSALLTAQGTSKCFVLNSASPPAVDGTYVLAFALQANNSATFTIAWGTTVNTQSNADASCTNFVQQNSAPCNSGAQCGFAGLSPSVTVGREPAAQIICTDPSKDCSMTVGSYFWLCWPDAGTAAPTTTTATPTTTTAAPTTTTATPTTTTTAPTTTTTAAATTGTTTAAPTTGTTTAAPTTTTAPTTAAPTTNSTDAARNKVSALALFVALVMMAILV